MDTLLVAATQEDDLVTELLQAFARNRRQRVVELATAIASNRGSFQGNGVSSNAQTPGTGKPVMPRPVAYRDKLLVAIQREEILIESLVAASAKGARTQLFSLCRDLAMNRGHIDPEFRWANNFPEDLSP